MYGDIGKRDDAKYEYAGLCKSGFDVKISLD